jgi:ATP-binding cassette subfamily B protein
VLGLLRDERRLAVTLAFANVAVAALQFYEPVLFGRVVDLLSTAKDRSTEALWDDVKILLIVWAAVGHRRHRRQHRGVAAGRPHGASPGGSAPWRSIRARAGAALLLPQRAAFRALLKIMLTGVDHLFGVWLSFFRENLATFVALFIMLPLSLFMNWRLGLLLIVLIVFFAIANYWVVGKTDRLQARVEEYHSELAGRAGDALGNIHLIQSFVGSLPKRARCIASSAARSKPSIRC